MSEFVVIQRCISPIEGITHTPLETFRYRNHAEIYVNELVVQLRAAGIFVTQNLLGLNYRQRNGVGVSIYISGV